MSTKPGECLVAREVPHLDDDITQKLKELELKEKNDEAFRNIQNISKTLSFSTQQYTGEHNSGPADYVTLQSIRSSALARKTNTTAKFPKGKGLLGDLLNRKASPAEGGSSPVVVPKPPRVGAKDVKAEDGVEKKTPVDKTSNDEKKEEVKEEPKEEKSEEKKEVEEKKDEEKKDEDKRRKSVDSEEEENEEGEDLISRGPVRHTRVHAAESSHPYQVPGRNTSYAAAAQSHVEDYSSFSSFGGGYECGASSWQDSPDTMLSSISTPDTVQSADGGYAPSISPTTPSPYNDGSLMTPADITRLRIRLLTSEFDMPDRLVDFILSYSRLHYSADREERSQHRPSSVDSACDSPMSAGSVPNYSPGHPYNGYTGRISPPGTYTSPVLMKDRPARMRFRESFDRDDLNMGVLWVCKCIQVLAKGALEHQDSDKDTLLHILIYHHDMNNSLAKAYALVEQQLKLPHCPDRLPYDLKNRFAETPLYLAVVIRNVLLVEYLLECGANPNIAPLRGSRDPALHYAASRGMVEMVKVLTADPRTYLNEKNGQGNTALHCAVKHHKNLDEETDQKIDNHEVIKVLIQAGANPLEVNCGNGQTIMHIAAEKADAETIDFVRHIISEDALTELVNKPDFNHEVPHNLLRAGRDRIEQPLHKAAFYALLTCGANVGRYTPPPSETPSPVPQ